MRAALLALTLTAFAAPSAQAQDATPQLAPDPRAGEIGHERMQRLFGAVRDVLAEAAEARGDAREADGMTDVLARQVGLDAASRAERLLDEAFGVVADAPVARIRSGIQGRRDRIGRLREKAARLREDRISAPVEGGVTARLGLTATRAEIDAELEGIAESIEGEEAAIAADKARFRQAMADSGVTLSAEESDLLIDSVTGGDIVRMAAAYEAARGVSRQLMELMDASGEDLARAKRYYAMHTALLALLVHAQTAFIEKVEGEYLPKLSAIERDVRSARAETERLLRARNTEAQRRALEGNRDSQAIALQAADFYRRHLMNQREEIVAARRKAAHELRIADNTLRTVDASFQLRAMMESATLSFEALQGLESPGVERIFRNEQLRREFQELSERLAPGS